MIVIFHTRARQLDTESQWDLKKSYTHRYLIASSQLAHTVKNLPAIRETWV